ncbi:MAG: GNAT family N-acetyltransferase [Acetatifactor sp.]|nr:GNAT family N-acetyltransferase [Acetatifactor sp.]
MKIVEITPSNAEQTAELVADFRVTLKSYKGIMAKPDIDAGKEEMEEYLASGFPCFVAVYNGEYAGYLVCRVDEPCVWVESIYTKPEYRRHGIASALLAKAEEVARGYGEETVFNYVHPNNYGMIQFLRRHGYTVLNLVEIRKPYTGEKLTQKINVGNQEFDY